MPEALEGVNWRAVEQAAIAGVPMKQIAAAHGILDADGKPDTNAIRQRAFRHKWPMPSRIRVEARKRLKADREARESVTPGVTRAEIEAEKAAKQAELGAVREKAGRESTVTVTDHLLANAEASSLIASQMALESLQAAPKRFPLSSIQDAAHALKTARNAAGIDAAQTQVNVQVNALWSSPALSSSASPDPFDVD